MLYRFARHLQVWVRLPPPQNRMADNKNCVCGDIHSTGHILYHCAVMALPCGITNTPTKTWLNIFAILPFRSNRIVLPPVSCMHTKEEVIVPIVGIWYQFTTNDICDIWRWQIVTSFLKKTEKRSKYLHVSYINIFALKLNLEAQLKHARKIRQNLLFVVSLEFDDVLFAC